MSKTENQNTEFKREWRDDALKTICAFSNTEGGTIYIGVDDLGGSVELKNAKKLLVDIPNKIRDMLGVVTDIKTVKRKNRTVLKITVAKYTAPISYKGKFYVRSGSITTELKGIALSRFLLSHSGTSWDSIIEPKSGIKDISVKAVRYFQELAKKRFPFVSKEKDLKVVLQKLNLIEGSKLKRAAILLFGKNPKMFFTSAYIKIGRFATEADVISTDVIEGNLFEQVERTMETLRLKYLQNRFYYEGIYRKEDLEYPEEALREAIINAVIHRDYIGSHTQLRVYNKRLTLWNDGKLVEGMTFELLKKNHPSCLRNDLLADIFFKAGLIEAWGRGTIKIIKNCEEKGLPTPSFSEIAGGFCISFFKQQEVERLPKFEEKPMVRTTLKLSQNYPETTLKIIGLIKENRYVTCKEMAKIIGITEGGIKYHLNKMRKDMLIERIGPAKGGHWQIKE